MPFKAGCLPMLKPFLLCARAYKKLHFHLLKLAHAVNDVSGYYFVSESLAYLRYTERYLHPARFLHVKIIYKYALRSFGSQVNNIGIISYGAHLGAEHQV